jgi:DNA-binding NtrC family response regulator
VIVGEPGTGRATTARIVHDSGGRADRPFVRVDCGRATTTDLTAELFGAGRQPGIVKAADGGTLLLERVDRLPLTAQLLLLRLIEDGTFRPRGAFADRTANVRALTTTTRRLESDVEAGRFRRDLYCRLSVVTIDVPPLRARGDDVVKLARHFARRGAELTGIELDDEVDALLRRYHWPGNVRELDLVVARARLLAPDALRLGPAAFPGLATPPAVDQDCSCCPTTGSIWPGSSGSSWRRRSSAPGGTRRTRRSCWACGATRSATACSSTACSSDRAWPHARRTTAGVIGRSAGTGS